MLFKKFVLAGFFLLTLTACQVPLGLRSSPTPPPSSTTQLDANSQTNLDQLMRGGAAMVVPDVEPETTTSITGITSEYGTFTQDRSQPFGTVTIASQILNNQQDEMFTIVAINQGFSGEDLYLVAFAPGVARYYMTDFFSLGHNAEVDSFTTGTTTTGLTTIDLTYRVHGPNQAMVDAPNVSRTREFEYEGGKFVNAGVTVP